MTDAEVRLKCLELAMGQARAEQQAYDRNIVVEISTLFYNHISLVTDTRPVGKAVKSKSADKPQIFE